MWLSRVINENKLHSVNADSNLKVIQWIFAIYKELLVIAIIFITDIK